MRERCQNEEVTPGTFRSGRNANPEESRIASAAALVKTLQYLLGCAKSRLPSWRSDRPCCQDPRSSSLNGAPRAAETGETDLSSRSSPGTEKLVATAASARQFTTENRSYEGQIWTEKGRAPAAPVENGLATACNGATSVECKCS
jgi:hypothetical protein